MDNINDMSDKMLDNIAELVLDKLLYKFKNELHARTPMSAKDLLTGYVPFKETDEEFLIAETARLMTLLHLYEDKEEYIKAAMIKRKLEIIQKKLDNL
jgi:murein L,D-transpeptidase YafK